MPIALWTKPLARLLALAALSLLSSSQSPPSPRGPVIAYLGAWPESEDPVYARFKATLAQRHPTLAARATLRHFLSEGSQNAKLDAAVHAALALRPAVLVAPTADDGRRATALSKDTPVVFSSYADPVAYGIRDAMQRSARPIAGVSLVDTMDAKRLELLRDAFPSIRHVAVLADRSWAYDLGGADRIVRAAEDLGLKTRLVLVDDLEELDTQFRARGLPRDDAWYIPATTISYTAQAQVIAHLQRLNVPAIHATVDEVRAGAVMAYEHDTSFAIDALADLVQRICHGEPAGQIPIQTPQRLIFAVRLPNGAGHPQPSVAVVRRADLVIR